MSQENDPKEEQVRPKRRSWTEEQKRAIVADCDQPGTSVSEVARKHGVPTNLLFQWRRQIRGGGPKVGVGDQALDPAIEYKSALTRIKRCEELSDAVHAKLMSDLIANRGTAYNLACGFSNLVNAVGKLAQIKLDLFDKMSGTGMPTEQDYDRDDVPYHIEVEAERMCFELVRARVEEKRAKLAVQVVSGASEPAQSTD